MGLETIKYPGVPECGYDGDAYRFININGTKTKVYTKFLTGTLDADAGTDVAHGVAGGLTNILSVNVACGSDSGGGAVALYVVGDHLGRANSATVGFEYWYDGTNVTITAVGTHLQGNAYRIRIDYTV